MSSRRPVIGTVPFDSVICFAVEGIFLLRLSFIYSVHFTTHPILTIMVTNAILNAVSDTFAQTASAMRSYVQHRDYDKEARLDAIREEYDLSVQARTEMLKGAEVSFDYERLARFVCYGFTSGMIQFKWFAWLDDAFPIAGHAALIKRLLADQLFYAPFALCFFFTFMTILDGRTYRDLKMKLQKQFVAAMKAQYLLWPVVQILNFKFVPLMYQLPFVSTISVFWNVYLSLILGGP